MLLASSLIPLAAQSLDGVWRSQGYGNLYQIHGPTLKTFEVTTTTCVPSFTAKAIAGREATFKSRIGVFSISAGTSDNRKLLQYADSLSTIKIERLPNMPAVCDPPTPNTPLGNFEVF